MKNKGYAKFCEANKVHYGSVEVAYGPFYNCGLVSQPLSEREAFSLVTVKWAIHFIETFYIK